MSNGKDKDKKEKKKSEFGKKVASATWSATKWFSKKTAKVFRDSVLLARPFNRKEQVKLSRVKEYLKPEEEKRLQTLLKQGKAEIRLQRLDWSFLISGKDIIPKLRFIEPGKRKFNPDLNVEIKQRLWIEELDKRIRSKFFELRFREFAERAYASVGQFIAPNIIGLQEAKQAAALQLFSKEPVHILLLGDPGTGKTDVLRSAKEISPVGAFGLGSGTSGAGLAVTVKGKKVLPGLLPSAHKGICCIDELNLMKKEDYAALYNAMEKGFITYDKGGHHYRFDAEVRVLGTANPQGDKFKSYTLSSLKEQMPFDSALLTRFHLVFIVKKANLAEFAEIAEKIVSEDKVKVKINDIIFLRRYARFANSLDVEIPRELADKIKDFVTGLKEKEPEFLFEVTPRTIIGITRLAKASARMELRSIVEGKDLERVFNIVTKAYNIT
jgi:DNA replicative helicase MCM subunit Mcm2 (Cdc46/Mcm family)